MSEIRRFIELLIPDDMPGGRTELRAIRPEAPAIQRFFVSADELAAVANQLCATCDVYVGIASRGQQNNGTKGNLIVSNALWADVDCGPDKPYASVDDAWATLGDFPLPASFVVESGGGLHAYWLLAQPSPLNSAENIAQFEAALKGIASALTADRASTDASRVLRVPGTVNHKWKPGRDVHLRELGLGRYELGDFADIASLTERPGSAGAGASQAPTASDEHRETAGVSGIGTKGRGLLDSPGPQGYPSSSEADLAALGRLRRAGLNESEAAAAFAASPRGADVTRRKSNPDDYVRRTTAKAYGNGALNGANSGSSSANGAAPRSHHVDEDVRETDLGNAFRLVRRHGEDLRYCFPWGRWLVWDGSRWAKDDTGEVVRRAKETVRSIFDEAKEAGSPIRTKELGQHSIRSQAEARIASMIALARSEPGIAVRPADLDQQPALFNTLNGTIDLETGALHTHRREDLITKIAPVVFEGDATCPTWVAFVNRIMGGNQELVQFVHRAIGYSLTADVSEQVLFFAYGIGSNGKSTLLHALLELTGDYGKQAAPGLLTVKRGERHPTEVADLAGARFVASVEIEEGRRLAEALTKWLTGGDRVKARFMRADFFEFEPTFKLWLAANHKPSVTGTDQAVWRRMRLIPFNVVIPDPEQDKSLDVKLRAELSGILNWAIEGCLSWRRQGLGQPDEVRASTAAYREEQDVIASFFEDCCVVGAEVKASATGLYQAYKKWCADNGESPLSQKMFGTRLGERGFSGGHREPGKGRIWWHGLGLVNDHAVDPDRA